MMTTLHQQGCSANNTQPHRALANYELRITQQQQKTLQLLIKRYYIYSCSRPYYRGYRYKMHKIASKYSYSTRVTADGLKPKSDA